VKAGYCCGLATDYESRGRDARCAQRRGSKRSLSTMPVAIDLEGSRAGVGADDGKPRRPGYRESDHGLLR